MAKRGGREKISKLVGFQSFVVFSCSTKLPSQVDITFFIVLYCARGPNAMWMEQHNSAQKAPKIIISPLEFN